MAGLISTQLMKLAKKYNCIGAFKEFGSECSECDERERCELLNLEGMSGDELLTGNESRRLVTLTRKFEKAGVPWKRENKPIKSKIKRKIKCRCKK